MISTLVKAPEISKHINGFCDKRSIKPVSVTLKGHNTRIRIDEVDGTRHLVYPFANRWIYKKPLDTIAPLEQEKDVKAFLMSNGLFTGYYKIDKHEDLNAKVVHYIKYCNYNRFRVPIIKLQATTIKHNNSFIDEVLIYPDKLLVFFDVVDKDLERIKGGLINGGLVKGDFPCRCGPGYRQG